MEKESVILGAQGVLDIGFSPCPNDTFIFDDMVNGVGKTGTLHFNTFLEDVETLNQWAFQGRLAVTKLSYNTILQVSDKYALLDSGSALGRGVGPLLLTTKEKAASIKDLSLFLQTASIAIPGKNTTANLLFTLAFPDAKNKTEVIFSDIENQLLLGNFDCGLVIHESRFTYQQKGLVKQMDMGDWWEQESGAPIPLGGICVRRDVSKNIAVEIQNLIKQSVAKSWQRYPQLSKYVTDHAQEMDEQVMRQHIDLYVNDYSASLGQEGRKAVDTLFYKAQQAGIIPEAVNSLYL